MQTENLVLYAPSANAHTEEGPEITPAAAALLGVSVATGLGPLLCAADELEALGVASLERKVVAVYGADPKQVYACRKAAYDQADACLTLSPETATRLELLHPVVRLAKSGKEVLRLVENSGKEVTLRREYCKVASSLGPMTILFVTNDFRVGGLEQVIIDIAALAKSLGHRPIITYAGIIEDITREDVEAAGIEHLRLPESVEDRKSLLCECGVSIVNAHYTTVLAQECKELGIPYLQTIHNMYLWLDDDAIAEWRELDKLTAGYIAVSANAAMVADLRLGLPPEKMIIVPNGAAMAERQPDCLPETESALRAELGIPPEGIVFVQVATLNGVKAHLVTIEAFRQALNTRQDIYLILLGKETDPTFTMRIRKKLAQYGLHDRVFIPGYRKDVDRFLNLARSMVAPSFIEGWSLAINEALQLGVPVIATDVGGACEQLRGESHIMLPAFFDNVESLSAMNFFAALTDENLHKSVASCLAKALLQASDRPRRLPNRTNSHGILHTEEAYLIHLEIMRHMILQQPMAPLRKHSYVQQRAPNGKY